ncbi:uncharacterized protein LOC131225263 isoform X1 [Magnolia sinica]|uniref:uncharacterized protein LOC131225263 isoform X1 n=1 Tax=Magnolia sinica TaxID=86752 RepID=UPI00265AADA8|nr:uncharacterized protein LOC131225263 isoform X1 [Magnolia sinica]
MRFNSILELFIITIMLAQLACFFYLSDHNGRHNHRDFEEKGLAIEKRILMSTVDMKDESKGRLIPKAKIEVLLGKTEKFDDLIVAVAAKGRQLETIKHDGKP